MQDTLKIRMLGEFSISYKDRTLGDGGKRSKKLFALLEYLIASRGKPVSQDELISVLRLDGGDIENPQNTLKTILYRLRSVLEDLKYLDSKRIVIYSRGTYVFNPVIPAEVDADVFEALCKKGSDPDTPPDERIRCLKQAVDMYKGDYLPKSAREDWALPLQARYHSMYVSAVARAVDFLAEASRWDEVPDICTRAIDVDPYYEPFHQFLIRSLMETGRRQAAVEHYDYVVDMLYNQLGVSPSDALVSLYKLIKRTGNDAELDLNIIKKSLREHDEISGAFYCEYEFFKDLYRIEARAAARNGQSVCIALLTVTDGEGAAPPAKVLNAIMQKLADVIQFSLRRGDIFSRYSVSQFLVMLSAVSFESAVAVAERIIKRYKSENPKPAVRIDRKIQPLDPVM